MIDYRPCAVCRAYVPADTGCRHWQPHLTPKAWRERQRRAAAREAVATARDRALGETLAAYAYRR